MSAIFLYVDILVKTATMGGTYNSFVFFIVNSTLEVYELLEVQ